MDTLLCHGTRLLPRPVQELLDRHTVSPVATRLIRGSLWSFGGSLPSVVSWTSGLTLAAALFVLAPWLADGALASPGLGPYIPLIVVGALLWLPYLIAQSVMPILSERIDANDNARSTKVVIGRPRWSRWSRAAVVAVQVPASNLVAARLLASVAQGVWSCAFAVLWVRSTARAPAVAAESWT